jgi:hypothetical protein
MDYAISWKKKEMAGEEENRTVRTVVRREGLDTCTGTYSSLDNDIVAEYSVASED